jgi:hypothetical protein
MTLTPNKVLLMAKLLSRQNSRISGISRLAGMRGKRLAALLGIQPSVSTSSCARKKMMSTA